MSIFRRQNNVNSIDTHEILADSVSIMRQDDHFDAKIERPLGNRSPIMFVVIVICGLLYLASRTAQLQLKKGQELYKKAQENRFITHPVFPPRGMLYDQFHKPLVENVPSLGLIFEKNDFLQNDKKNIGSLLESLSSFLHKDKSFFYELGFPQEENLTRLPETIFIIRDLSPEEVVSIASHLDALPGIKVYEGYRRMYHEPLAESHLVGYIGKVSQNDLENNPELSHEEFVGKSGIEMFYDEKLRGKEGKKIVEINSLGEETRFKLTQNAEEGSSLELTIDGELQHVSYNLLQNYTDGKFGASVVILDPKTGAVRALVSYPGFDSTKFGLSLTKKEFDAIISNPLHQLFNRAISGEFPSGSVIKPMVAAAALQENIIDPHKKIYDEGFIEIPNPYKPGTVSVFKDWRKQGWIDFYEAIAYSANVYFYMIGGGFRDQKGLGIQKLKEYASFFGFGSKLGIDLPGEKTGFFPDPDTKAKLEQRDPIWRIGDTYNTVIGQGGVKVTPIQVAAMTAALAYKGTLYRPFIVETIRNREGNVLQHISPQIIRDHLIEEKNLAEVMRGLEQAVTIGTAHRLGSLPVLVGAKTGTAQAGSGKPHAWVSAIAPAENPEIVAVVMVEHAGEGSTVAVPIMHDILEWYFQHRKDGSPI